MSNPHDNGGKPKVDQDGASQPEPVGYKRPPVHTRFKPGQSGNPRGRPKPRGTITNWITRILGSRVRVKEGNKVRSVTKSEAVASRVVNEALKGDTKALKFLLGATPDLEKDPPITVVIRKFCDDEPE
jgi:Family of unknown function (DUF5681)